MARGSPSRPGRRATPPAPTSTSGRSARTTPSPLTTDGTRRSPRGPATASSSAARAPTDTSGEARRASTDDEPDHRPGDRRRDRRDDVVAPGRRPERQPRRRLVRDRRRPTTDGACRPDEGRLELHRLARGRAATRRAQVVVDGAIGDFDVRWDETGEWFAVWTADPPTPAIGRLSLFRVDPRPASSSDPRTPRPRAGAARVLHRRRTAGLGHATGPGRRGQPRPDRGLGGRRRRQHRERTRARISSSSADRDARCASGRYGRRRTWYRSPPIVRPRWTVVGSVLTATLALVALPGLAGSRAPSAVEPVPARRVPAAPGPRVRPAIGDPDRRARWRLPVGGLRAARTPRSSSESDLPRDAGPGPRTRSTSPTRADGSARKPAKYTLTGEATFYDAGSTAMRLPRGTVDHRVRRRAAASSGSSTTTARRSRRGSSTCIAPDFFAHLRLPVVERRRRRHGLRLLTRPPAVSLRLTFGRGPVRPPAWPCEAGKER